MTTDMPCLRQRQKGVLNSPSPITGTPRKCRTAEYVVCMHGHTYSKSMDQPGKVANPARGQLNRENEYLPVRVRA